MKIFMTSSFRALASALMAATVFVGAAAAQDATGAPSPDQVVARVNGEEITNGDLDQIAQELRDQIARIPPDQVFSVLVNVMIDIKLMARAAEAEGIADADEVKRRIANLRDNQLRAEYLRVKAFEPVNDEAIKARYDTEMAAFVPGDEVHARHILVGTEDEAKAVIKQLNEGGDFAELAKEKSTDPGSGRNGGDLGFFGKGTMVPVFEEAAFKLKPGEYTAEPVQSQFGWHVIQVEETRKEPTPTLQERTIAIRQELVREALTAASKSLRDSAEIELVGADGEAIPADKPADAQ